MNTGVAGFTRKTGVFFAYGVDGPEFPPALYEGEIDEVGLLNRANDVVDEFGGKGRE